MLHRMLNHCQRVALFTSIALNAGISDMDKVCSELQSDSLPSSEHAAVMYPCISHLFFQCGLSMIVMGRRSEAPSLDKSIPLEIMDIPDTVRVCQAQQLRLGLGSTVTAIGLPRTCLFTCFSFMSTRW